jgi:hypothetical protein
MCRRATYTVDSYDTHDIDLDACSLIISSRSFSGEAFAIPLFMTRDDNNGNESKSIIMAVRPTKQTLHPDRCTRVYTHPEV